MKTKHTPGQWKVQPFKSWDKDIVILGPGVKVDHDDVDHEEAEANARLIAAAPDLLQTLRAIEYYVSSQMPNDGHAYAIANECKIAIAKATGGKQ